MTPTLVSLTAMKTLLIAMGFGCQMNTDSLTCGNADTKQWVIVDVRDNKPDILTSKMGYPLPVLAISRKGNSE